MKDNKKVKIGKLNFYLIDEDYISYLSQFDFKLLEEKYWNIVEILKIKSDLNISKNRHIFNKYEYNN